MTDWLLHLLGLDPARLPPEAQWRFVWLNAPSSWGAVLLLGVVAAALWGVFRLYQREQAVCPRRLRRLLAVVRAVVLLALAAVFLGPAVAMVQKRVVQPLVLVLVDDSLSMTIADRYADDEAARRAAAVLGADVAALRARRPPRSQLVDHLLRGDEGRFLQALADKGEVTVSGLADRTPLLTIPPRGAAARPAPADPAAGRGWFESALASLAGLGVAGLLATGVLLAAGLVLPSRRLLVGAVAGGALAMGLTVGSLAWLEARLGARRPTRGAAPEAPSPVLDPALLAPLQIRPAAPATNLAKAVREGLRSAAGRPIAAVVLISDGQNTEGDDPLAAADAAAALHAPVFTLGVGDPTRPRNLRVADIWARDTVWRDDPFQIEASLQAVGLEGQTVQVELRERPADAAGDAAEKVLARRAVTFAPGRAQENVSFQHRPRQAGRFVFTVRAEPVANEWVEDDNVSRPALVEVVSEPARVLLVSGTPSWDYQLVRNLLLRDKTINLSCWLQSLDPDIPQEGTTPIKALPDKAEDLLKYDLVILMDPNPIPAGNPLEFSNDWVGLMERFLGEHGGGMLFMAGPQYTWRFLSVSQTAGFRRLLPVEFDSSAGLELESLVTPYNRPWPLALTAEAVDHPATRFDADAALNRRIWDLMPGIYWSFPARSAKPAARILLEHGDPALRTSAGSRPLLVAGQYGPGRTLYAGFSGTWRWRRLGSQSEYFDKFWVQCVRYLVEGRRLGGARRGILSTDGDLYPLGARVAVSARLYGPTFDPLNAPAVRAVLTAPGAPPHDLELKPVAQRPGYFEATVEATRLGVNELAVELPAELGAGPVRLTRRFSVELPRREFSDPRLNKPLLTELAARSGGRYFEIDQAALVAPALPDRAETIITRGKPIELWDTRSLMLALAALLTVEWALRKAYKLM